LIALETAMMAGINDAANGLVSVNTYTGEPQTAYQMGLVQIERIRHDLNK